MTDSSCWPMMVRQSPALPSDRLLPQPPLSYWGASIASKPLRGYRCCAQLPTMFLPACAQVWHTDWCLLAASPVHFGGWLLCGAVLAPPQPCPACRPVLALPPPPSCCRLLPPPPRGWGHPGAPLDWGPRRRRPREPGRGCPGGAAHGVQPQAHRRVGVARQHRRPGSRSVRCRWTRYCSALHPASVTGLLPCTLPVHATALGTPQLEACAAARLAECTASVP